MTDTYEMPPAVPPPTPEEFYANRTTHEAPEADHDLSTVYLDEHDVRRSESRDTWVLILGLLSFTPIGFLTVPAAFFLGWSSMNQARREDRPLATKVVIGCILAGAAFIAFLVIMGMLVSGMLEQQGLTL